MVVIDNFSKFGRTIPWRRNAQTLEDSFEHIVSKSKRKPKLIGTDDGKEFVNQSFTNFLRNNNIKQNSRSTSRGAVSPERFITTVRNLLKKPVFKKGDADWIDVSQKVTKTTIQYILRLNYHR